MKKIFVTGILVVGLGISVWAQSGRRVKTAQPPTPSAESSTTEETTAAASTQESTTGYSESAPNRSRPLYNSRNDNKKSKSNTKSQPPTAETAQKTTADASAGDEDVLKIETNLITIPVSVNDRNGLYIPHLQQKDFKIFEDGKEQEVAYFGTTDKPFTVVLLIDVSPSTEYKIEQIQNAAISFVDQLEPQDSVVVMEFDSGVHVLTGVTKDRDEINKAIRKTSFGNGTSLYDAVDNALRKQLGKIEGRKAVVLFTDGVDTTSGRASYERTVRDAEESDAVIFPIYFNTYLQNIGIGGGGVMSTPPTLGLPGGIGGGGGVNQEMKEAYALGRAYLQDLADATGGRVYRPEGGGLADAFEGIAEELRRQYSIGYYPQNEGQAGQRKQIRVRVNRPNLVIRSRDSYIVGEINQQQKTK